MRTTTTIAAMAGVAITTLPASARPIDFSFTTDGQFSISSLHTEYLGHVTDATPNLGFVTISSTAIIDMMNQTTMGPGQWTGANGSISVILFDAFSGNLSSGTWEVTSGDGVWTGFTGSGTYNGVYDFNNGTAHLEFRGTLVPTPGAGLGLGFAGILVASRRRRPGVIELPGSGAAG
jgi:hypothetical protein